MKIALPLSQYIDQVKVDLLPIMGAIVLREEKHLDVNFEYKDMLFHTNGFIDDEFDLSVNGGKFLQKLNSYVKLLSFDLGPSCRKVACPEEGYAAKSPVLNEDQILHIAEKKLMNIRKHFKGRISVENLDYHPTGAYEIVCIPEFIHRFVVEFNTGLTIDIGHVEVTCNNLSMNEYEYLEQLPLSKVTEVHLTHSPGALDVHLLPKQKEYRLLDFILKKVNPDYIVLEYYKDPGKIISGNRQLMDFLKRRGLYEN